MRLRFTPDQPHQREALQAVVDVLRGQRAVPPHEMQGPDGVLANRLHLGEAALLANIRVVQARAGLPVDEALAYPELGRDMPSALQRVPNLSIEMETGTGKTYTYLRTALELGRRYGLRKFVVVVPSVAIREGVLKTLQLTRDHFAALYPDQPYRFFAYDARRVGLVNAFARSGRVELMVVTVDAFNKAENVLCRPHDRFGGDSPLARLRATRPIVILDEPHNFESALRRRALADLHPLLVLRYGATHRRHQMLLHRLSAREAQARGLVKRVEILDVPTDSLSDEAAMSARLRTTIESHLRRQAELRPRGIKVLSLVFIDRVDGYAGTDAPIGRAFDRHFEALAHLDPPSTRLHPQQVRAAYFAERRTRKGAVPIDSRTGRSVADEHAYRLIMRDKERLLSFEEPVAFVFSHSALREGWDNPNVFQICTLAPSHSSIKKRQEIGRGVRLCVDQTGRRILDPDVNVLRIVAHESYDDYIATLRSELGAAAEGDGPRLPVRARSSRKPEPPASPRRTEPRLVVPESLVAEATRRARSRLDASVALPAKPQPLPALVDLVLRELEHLQPAAPIRRSTILSVLEGIEPRIHLIHDPHGVTTTVARALVETLDERTR